ncbi:MAG: adenylate/guanylate cyclase domain-containing protein [Eubacteriales bacterium]|nr:adenylate/guanylate cyclase domain-containing protein [Eubacteriales bacterium]
MSNIWVIGTDKKELIAVQRQVNEMGSMRAICMLTVDAVKKGIIETQEIETAKRKAPSLVIVDYQLQDEMCEAVIQLLKEQPNTAGVPLVFMMESTSKEQEALCYDKGATAVMQKPLMKSDWVRMERIAWQYDMTKSYERVLQKQASDLMAAKEIERLNEQLKARNELLYHLFGRYFSDEVVEMMIESPEYAVIGGQRCSVAIMMADLRGFTSVSEVLAPDAVTRVLNHFFSNMMEVIQQYHGTVIELLGDAILAVFGAPKHSDMQVENAIRAAILMQNQMKEVNAFCAKEGYPLLEMGIGLHGGEVFVGNVGAEHMMRYNVIGQDVNLCSRIESYSIGGQVLASRELVEKAKESVRIKSKIDITVKGVQKPIPICEIIGIGEEQECALEYEKEDVLLTLHQKISVMLYPIEDKMVTGHAIEGWLEQCSRKRAVIVFEKQDVSGLQEFLDVKIMAWAQEGSMLFSDVYAKIVEMGQDGVILRFTHINKAFQEFVRREAERI